MTISDGLSGQALDALLEALAERLAPKLFARLAPRVETAALMSVAEFLEQLRMPSGDDREGRAARKKLLCWTKGKPWRHALSRTEIVFDREPALKWARTTHLRRSKAAA
jgi:hypothetical protein